MSLPSMSRDVAEKLVSKYPDMAEITYFEGTVGEFYGRYSQFLHAPSARRRQQLLTAVEIVARRVFSDTEVKSIIESLEKNFIVSTAEHHASITHPETLNIVLNQFLIQEKANLPVISFSCATTTLDNHLFPRGVFIGDEKIPFLPKSQKSYFVSNAPGINIESFTRRLRELQRISRISKTDAEFLEDWFDAEYGILKKYPLLSMQISRLNQDLWKSIIHKNLQYDVFNYFMIPAEDIVENLLLLDMESERPSWIFESLFKRDSRARIFKLFDGTRLFWNSTNRKGTFFFWGYNARNRPVQLFLTKDHLVSDDSELQVELTPESIKSALAEKRIVPASNLCSLYLSFYSGLSLIGGILQVNYLGEMKRKILSGNPLHLRGEDLSIIDGLLTNIYANFQRSRWTEGGMSRIVRPLSDKDLEDYQTQDHFSQIQECLQFLYSL